jgi:hypothetical protein
MARTRQVKNYDEDFSQPSITPAMTPEDQEDQLISLAVDLAVKRLREGTASNQLVSEIIKLGTTKERLAKEKLQRENEMLRAKTEAIEASRRNGEMYAEALKAMREYAGVQAIEDDDYDEEDY